MEEITTYATNLEFNLWNNSDNLYHDNSTYNDTNLTAIPPTTNRDVSRYYPIIVAEMILSCLCLLFSIVVCCILPEFKNVHGKNLISMSSCMLATFLMLILDLIIRNHIPFVGCFIIAMIIHVMFLGTFFWTNIMTFDIWISLTDMKAKADVKSRSKKYLKYSAYAWTATALTAMPAAILESTSLVPLEYRPQFGVRRCWLSGTTAFIYYFNFPVGVILFCNLVMFTLTIRKLIIIKKMTAVLNVKKQQKRLNLYLKLFLIMGITWTVEFLPWATGVHGLYALAGMLTGLHGCFLFFIFVGKKRILRQFYEKVRFGIETPTTSATTPSTSQPTSSDNKRKYSVDHLGDSKF